MQQTIKEGEHKGIRYKITLFGSISYDAHALGRVDRGYRTARQAITAAKRMIDGYLKGLAQ